MAIGEVPTLWVKAMEQVAQAIGSLKAAEICGGSILREALADNSEMHQFLDGVDRLRGISEELSLILGRMAVSIDNARFCQKVRNQLWDAK